MQDEVAADVGAVPTEASRAEATEVLGNPSVEDVCSRIAKKLASIKFKECMDGGLSHTGGFSVRGYPLLSKEYAPIANQEPMGRVLLVGGIHGDEYSSVSIVLKWMGTLNKHHTGLFHWMAVPLLNPDGLLRPKSQRMNQNGVDLNRNFPTPNWHEESRQYWIVKTRQNPRRFPGDSPLSEPESRWLYEKIHEFKPDIIVSVHAPYGILDFDGPRDAPKRLGRLHLNALGTYPGSLGNYAGVQNDIPVITIELQNSGSMPPTAEANKIWADLVFWLKKNIKAKSSAQLIKTSQADPS